MEKGPEERKETEENRNTMIEEMEQYCKNHNIYNYLKFVEYCMQNNRVWYYELAKGESAFKHMRKVLRYK